MAELAMLVAAGAQMAGSVIEGVSTNQQAKAEAAAGIQAATIQQQSLEQKAAEERAAGQRAAAEQRKEGELLQSRQVAVAASSGAGATNATVLDLIGDAAQRTEYLAASERYGADQRAKGLIDQGNFGVWQAKTSARAARAKGKGALVGSIFEAIGTGAKGYANAQ